MMGMAVMHEKTSMYPEVQQSNPEAPSSTKSSLYPSIDDEEVAEDLSLVHLEKSSHEQDASIESKEEQLIIIPCVIVNLIDDSCSVQLASGDLSVIRLRQGENTVAVLARVSDDIQWPLTKDEAAVKLDDSHYFFSLRTVDAYNADPNSETILNYGVTIAPEAKKELLNKFDEILRTFSSFSEQMLSEEAKRNEKLLLDEPAVKDALPADMPYDEKEIMEGRCIAFWTALAPNVEDYSTCAAKMIAAGSGQLIKGILWCGDVTVDRLNYGKYVMMKKMKYRSEYQISADTLKRIRRVKKMTNMTEKVSTAILSGVVKVSGFFTSSIANSKPGKKFFSLLPGEIVLASLDGFNKVCDAVEVAGRNVMSTSSSVTTQLVSNRYGDQAAEATHEGLQAAGHAFVTAWAAFKIRKALNPKSVLKPTSLAKSAAKATAADIKAKNSK